MFCRYDACMDVTESDHKPVRCKYSVDIAHVDRSVRREEFGKVLKSNDSIRSMLAELHQVPETAVSTDTVYLKNQDTSILRITNKSNKEMVVFRIICDGLSTWKEDTETSDRRARGSFGFPRWLEVPPHPLAFCFGVVLLHRISYQVAYFFLHIANQT